MVPRAIAIPALWVCLLALSSARGASFKTGAFTKDTGPAPAQQTLVHGLGMVPKALFVWSGRTTAPVSQFGMTGGYGFTDGTVERTFGVWSEHGVSPTNNGRWADQAVLVILQPDGVVDSVARFVSWDAGSFTIDWTTNGVNPVEVFYWVVGGNEVQAKVLSWNLPTVTGLKPVGGVGFQPDLLINLHAGDDYTGPGGVFGGSLGLSVGTGDLSQTSFASLQRYSLATSDTYGLHSEGEFLVAFGPTAIATRATLASVDADGFTANFSQVGGGGGLVATLALGGMRASTRTFPKPIVTGPPIDESFTGFGFAPELLLFGSADEQTSPSDYPHTTFIWGAADAANSSSLVIDDSDAVPLSNAHTYARADRALASVTFGPPTWEASRKSLDADGFTLTWSNNTSRPADALAIALATDPAAPCVTNCGSPPPPPPPPPPGPEGGPGLPGRYTVSCASAGVEETGVAAALPWLLMLLRVRRRAH